MASDVTTGQIPVASPVQGSQAKSISVQSGSGKPLPPGGKSAAPQGATVTPNAGPATVPAADKAPVPHATESQSLANQLNKFLNSSGRPDQYRVDPASGGKVIQQVNPATGAVIGEFSAEEFPALARSVGVSGLFVDRLA